ncbi:putative crossover junction endonuclease mus-81 [Podospora australis]|uniref:Crossover junction endonuclease MUS81 n=1 Tax=Podospora australis TaxID=1536484 RepID=A0AAN7AL75_9PEZI|nr:putative crossover junction endonuclease mus-81 [Podospora australis]
MPEEAECANPLLLSWVKEWWDVAKERNTKGVIVYKHAYDSLKACPIEFQHPSHLSSLKGFGPKLCARLTQQLEKHCEANGLPMPKATRKRAVRLPGEDEVPDEAAAAPPPAKKSRKARAYVPTYRSGNYAILYVLAGQPEDAPVGMSKEDLIAAAQPYCDASFTVFQRSSGYGSFYTAWDSIKILISKELVYERGRPTKRYALTDEGWEVATRVREVAVSKGDIIDTGIRRKMEDHKDNKDSISGVGAVRNGGRPDDRVVIGSNSGNDIGRLDLPEYGSGIGSNSFLGGGNNPARSTSGSGSVPRTVNSGVSNRAPGGNQATTHEQNDVQRAAQSSVIVIDDDEDDENGTVSINDTTMGDTKPKAENEFKNVVADGDAVPSDSDLPTFRPIRLQPGSFTVELVLDIREVRAKTDRDYMRQELTKKGVKPIMRALELGDALWVAKCKQPGWLSRMGAEGDEVILDWIVERKRLDDLIGSIKDGRFHEQKFRLRRSGIKNVIYLVEEMSMDANHYHKYEEAVQSAIASVQVVNGYFLKKTQKTDDSIQYLAAMTRLLQKTYEGKSLHVIPTNVLTARNYLPLVKHLREKEPELSHHISYPAFSSLCSKSDLITLRDLYLKMLMVTRGVTGERAIEIQKVWKTPRELIRAYQQCGSGEEGKKRKHDLIFDRMAHLPGNIKFGKALSQKIAQVWGDA